MNHRKRRIKRIMRYNDILCALEARGAVLVAPRCGERAMIRMWKDQAYRNRRARARARTPGE